MLLNIDAAGYWLTRMKFTSWLYYATLGLLLPLATPPLLALPEAPLKLGSELVSWSFWLPGVIGYVTPAILRQSLVADTADTPLFEYATG